MYITTQLKSLSPLTHKGTGILKGLTTCLGSHSQEMVRVVENGSLDCQPTTLFNVSV